MFVLFLFCFTHLFVCLISLIMRNHLENSEEMYINDISFFTSKKSTFHFTVIFAIIDVFFVCFFQTIAFFSVENITYTFGDFWFEVQYCILVLNVLR